MTAAVSSPALPSVNLVAALSGPPAHTHGAGFAKMLDAHRAEAPAEPPPADKPKAEDTAAADNAQATRNADEARNRQLRANRQTGTRPQATDGPAVHEPRAAADAAEAQPIDTEVSAAEDTEPAVDPSLADWLASLNLPAAQPAAETTAQPTDPRATLPADPTAGAEQAASDLSATLATAERGAARRAAPAAAGSSETAQRQRQQPEDLKVERPDPRADARQAVELPSTFQAVMEQVSLPVPQARAIAGESSSSPKVDMAAAAQALSGATPLADRPAAEMAAPTVVHVPTPADAPEFPQALGAQLSVFAKDGVQQAELHLNPSDMGPISVQIALDGDQAKVDFGVDSATTRQIIENGLPELAAALRDAGFTLSGGGVHSQAQQQGQRDREGGQPGHPSGRQAPADEPMAAARPAVRNVRAGGVDLYA